MTKHHTTNYRANESAVLHYTLWLEQIERQMPDENLRMWVRHEPEPKKKKLKLINPRRRLLATL